ncbi:hypothetical protein SAMN05421858_3635 [Haladaptatus litoreus]|uniref:Uncharacterized protein n=1 Tax=Haladaptatus litoreus TaxID=553468 RepID=A0A1N7DI80_9EURY|nr:hypothetical protein SAMN05421858_3635 [Haladaptatus litoreus]
MSVKFDSQHLLVEKISEVTKTVLLFDLSGPVLFERLTHVV